MNRIKNFATSDLNFQILNPVFLILSILSIHVN
jgi:hypothetical protein